MILSRSLAAAALAVALLAPSHFLKADTIWNGGDGLWYSANWSNGIPNGTTDAHIDNLPATSSAVTLDNNPPGAPDANPTGAVNNLTIDTGDALLIGGATPGGTITLAAAGITNNGTLSPGNDLTALLNVSGTVTNNGTIIANNNSIFRVNISTLINNGTLAATVGTALGDIELNSTNIAGGMNITGSGNIVANNNSGFSIDNPVTVSSTGYLENDTQTFFVDAPSSITVANLRGNGAINGSASGTTTITITGGDTANPYTGTITGNFNVVKSGTGTQIFTGANQYSGTTTISGGTLQIDNTNIGNGGAGFGNVTVQNHGTLSGTGSVEAFAFSQAGGTIAPGDDGPGTLTFFGLTLQPDSVLDMQIADAAGQSDLIRVDNSGFTVNDIQVYVHPDGPVTAGKIFTLIDYTNSIPGDAFTAADFNLAPGSIPGVFSIDTADDLVQFTPSVSEVPEPASLLLLGLALPALLLPRRRRV